MTTYNKASLKTFFEQADIPQGTDYANLIDSQVNIAETSQQNMAGALSTTKLITPLVSASSVDAIALGAQTGSFSSFINTASLIVTLDVSATTGTVYTSAVRSMNGLIGGVAIVSAAGTALATAAQLSAYMTRAQGVTDGSATGFKLPVPIAGFVSYLINESAVSANLYPAGADYQINALASGAAFALAASTSYVIIHKTASAYAVK